MLRRFLSVVVIAVMMLIMALIMVRSYNNRVSAATLTPGETIALIANSNSNYVCAEDAGTSPLNSSRASYGNWEKFLVVDAGGGLIALKATINNKYVSVQANTQLLASATSIGINEKFRIINAGGEYVNIKAYVNGKYLCADISPAIPMTAESTTAAGWEKFKIVNVSGGYLGVTCGFTDTTLEGGPYMENSGDPVNNLPLYKPIIGREDLFWDNYIEECERAGVDFIAPTIRGYLEPVKGNSNEIGDTRKLTELVAAINRRGSSLKISALDDNPQSMTKKKNWVKYGILSSTPKFDMADVDGTGEGGYQYIWDNNWRAFFQSVPDNMRFKIDGRPVIYTWNIGNSSFTNQGNGNSKRMIEYIRERCQIEFGFNPYIIVHKEWLNRDPDCSLVVDGVHDWFNGNGPGWTMRTFNGRTYGALAPAFEKLDQYLDPKHGQTLKTNLQNTVGSGAYVTLVEGLTDWAEDCALWRAKEAGYSVTHYDYPNQRLNILRSYSKRPGLSNVRIEAESADSCYDTTSGNTYGVYRDGNLDVQACTDTKGGWNVGSIAENEWLQWEEIALSGSRTLSIRVSTPNKGKRLRFEVDGAAQPWVAIPSTGDWQNWQTVSCGTYNLSKGTHTIRIYTDTGGFNLNYWISN